MTGITGRLAAAGVVLACVAWLRLDPSDLWTTGGWQTLTEFASAALHPAWVDEGGRGVWLVPVALRAARATVAFAAAAMGISVVAGLVLGVLASPVTWRGHPVGSVAVPMVRVWIAALRSVHELLWAMLLLAAVGLSPTSAVLAIAIPYTGILAKVYSELIDEADRDAAVALEAAGAGRIAAFAVGILPRVAPDLVAYTFYRFECALRSSAVLGFFGFPTLGYTLAASASNLAYREVWLYLYALLALILVADAWSAAVRRRLVVA
ncbi:MAG: ABC transporter permease subunit [Myxococcales bacterium]|nr:ABC transporter permease subunit [Myxococcales bacterium]